VLIFSCCSDFVLIFLLFQINCVVMRGINDDELCDFVGLTEKKVTAFCAFLFYVKQTKIMSLESHVN